jgi:DNA/RNA endonuclease G (NUC1)
VVLFEPVVGIAAPFDDCKDHLPFGVPKLSTQANTTAICHLGYVVLHDDKFLVPRWVAYRLTGPHTFGCLARTNNFHADENLPDGKRATPADYRALASTRVIRRQRRILPGMQSA